MKRNWLSRGYIRAVNCFEMRALVLATPFISAFISSRCYVPSCRLVCITAEQQKKGKLLGETLTVAHLKADVFYDVVSIETGMMTDD